MILWVRSLGVVELSGSGSLQVFDQIRGHWPGLQSVESLPGWGSPSRCPRWPACGCCLLSSWLSRASAWSCLTSFAGRQPPPPEQVASGKWQVASGEERGRSLPDLPVLRGQGPHVGIVNSRWQLRAAVLHSLVLEICGRIKNHIRGPSSTSSVVTVIRQSFHPANRKLCKFREESVF